MLLIPDDKKRMQERMGDPLRTKMVPKGLDPIDPGEMISQAVAGSSQMRLPRRNPNDVQQPTFDAKKSRLAGILGITGAIATALSPDSTAGAIGSGLAAGGAGIQQDLAQTFLANQEQAAKISEAIRQRNEDIDDMEFKAGVERSREALRQENRLEQEKVQHGFTMKEIEARESADLETAQALEKYKRGLPMTEKDRESLNIDRYQAETSRMQEERLRKQRGSGGTAQEDTPRAKEVREVDASLREIDRKIAAQQAALGPVDPAAVTDEEASELRGLLAERESLEASRATMAGVRPARVRTTRDLVSAFQDSHPTDVATTLSRYLDVGALNDNEVAYILDQLGLE